MNEIYRLSNTSGSIRKNAVLATVALIIFIVLNILIMYCGQLMDSIELASKFSYFKTMESPFVIFLVYEMFLVSVKAKPFTNFVINKIASATFGIYLIHEHNLMQQWLFPVALKNVELYQTDYFILGALVSVAIAFTACCTIDLIRQKLFWRVKQNVIELICNFDATKSAR